MHSDTFEAAMVEVSHVVCMKFGDGKKLQIPDALVVKELVCLPKLVQN